MMCPTTSSRPISATRAQTRQHIPSARNTFIRVLGLISGRLETDRVPRPISAFEMNVTWWPPNVQDNFTCGPEIESHPRVSPQRGQGAGRSQLTRMPDSNNARASSDSGAIRDHRPRAHASQSVTERMLARDRSEWVAPVAWVLPFTFTMATRTDTAGLPLPLGGVKEPQAALDLRVRRRLACLGLGVPLRLPVRPPSLAPIMAR